MSAPSPSPTRPVPHTANPARSPSDGRVLAAVCHPLWLIVPVAVVVCPMLVYALAGKRRPLVRHHAGVAVDIQLTSMAILVVSGLVLGTAASILLSYPVYARNPVGLLVLVLSGAAVPITVGAIFMYSTYLLGASCLAAISALRGRPVRTRFAYRVVKDQRVQGIPMAA